MRPQIPIDTYVVDTLMRDLVGHDRMPSAFVVFLFLYRRIETSASQRIHLSYQTIAHATGLSRRTVQQAVARLSQRRLIRVRRSSATATPEYSLQCHWRRRSS